MISPGRAVTIDDIARVAGVSVATVSRALRSLPNVAPSTRTRVREVADRLGYLPDPAATHLATGRSQTVAMAVPHLNSWYFSQVMAGAEAVLTEAGYDLLLFATDNGISTRRVTQGPLVRRTDGLILVDVNLSKSEAATLSNSRVKIVTVGSTVADFSSVRIDDEKVATTAVQYLVELGHTRIALLTGLVEDPLHFEVPQARRRGYLRTLTSAGLPIPPELERAGNFSVEGGSEAMHALLDLAEPPTAVFAMSDEMAYGAIQAAQQRGLRIPEDLSIIGVDDHEFSSVIGLSTVHQNVPEHGTLAARLLLDELGDAANGNNNNDKNNNYNNNDTEDSADTPTSSAQTPPIRIQIPTNLIQRTSTAPPNESTTSS